MKMPNNAPESLKERNKKHDGFAQEYEVSWIENYNCKEIFNMHNIDITNLTKTQKELIIDIFDCDEALKTKQHDIYIELDSGGGGNYRGGLGHTIIKSLMTALIQELHYNMEKEA